MFSISRREGVIAIQYLRPGIEQNSKKITFDARKRLFGQKLHPNAFSWFSKTKTFVSSISFRRLVKQRPQQPRWSTDFGRLLRAGRSGPTTLTLVGPKILLFPVKVLRFQDFGRTNNCLVEILLKWSDQYGTSSAAPVYPINKARNHEIRKCLVQVKNTL